MSGGSIRLGCLLLSTLSLVVDMIEVFSETESFGFSFLVCDTNRFFKAKTRRVRRRRSEAIIIIRNMYFY